MNFQPNNNSVLSKSLLLAFGAFVGVVVHMLYASFVESLTVTLVLLNVLGIISIYSFLHNHYKNERRKLINQAIEGILSIQTGKMPEGVAITPVAKELMNAISDTKQFLKQKEQNRSNILQIIDSVTANIELSDLLDELLQSYQMPPTAIGLLFI